MRRFAPLRQRTADRSNAILDAALSAIIAIDLKGRVVSWNQAASALTGSPAGQIRGRIFDGAIVSPRYLDAWRIEFQRIRAGSAPRNFDTAWKLHNGSILALTCSFSLVRDDAHVPELVVCTVVDPAFSHHRAALSAQFQSEHNAELQDISRFIHDTISQDLVTLAFSLANTANTALIDRCCRDIRVISYTLAPPPLSDSTLETLIEQYANYVQLETGIHIDLDLDPVSASLPIAAQSLLLGAVQDWFARAVRGRSVGTIAIRLRDGVSQTVLELNSQPATGLSSHDGWSVLRAHVHAQGGELEIAHDNDEIRARLSLPAAAERVQ